LRRLLDGAEESAIADYFMLPYGSARNLEAAFREAWIKFKAAAGSERRARPLRRRTMRATKLAVVDLSQRWNRRTG
jgi:hypothetical protein